MIQKTLEEIVRLAEQIKSADDIDVASFAACVIMMSQALQGKLGAKGRIQDKHPIGPEYDESSLREPGVSQVYGIGTNVSSHRLLELLVYRFMQPKGPGANVLIRRTCLELFGAEPTPDEFQSIAKSFDNTMQRDHGFSPFPSPLSPSLTPVSILAISPSPGGIQRRRFELNSADNDPDAYRPSFDH